MPTTNRVLIPTDGYLYYLRVCWPVVQSGLAIFAILVILRRCLTSFCWSRRRIVVVGEEEEEEEEKGEEDAGLEAQILEREKEREREKEKKGVTMMGDDIVEEAEEEVEEEEKEDSKQSLKSDDEQPLIGQENYGAGSATVPPPLPPPFLTRIPPAPPLTPPELSNTIFTVEEAPHRQDSFIHQPNPDYLTSTAPLSSTTITTTPSSSSSSSSSSRPRRRSYTRTLPIGIPMPRSASSHADLTFSPRSYPPTSPLLPPPPPSPQPERTMRRRDVDVRGEIISVLDHGGAGWTRHTRVYGGGVCLACAAAGGGFYGATVSPEEMS
ncbi:hypothetical protein XA68_17952 [Ophiocordyceps unilateralis]|uniref:Uncharacterized protein n=1 Tax=Ophiocordyceps unilateralis TaxID=268505 RepID=A0A2A9P2Q2_OPHUN|nr:hypothetical protein XA68_17952 [Ophiocordyceps unilateralis]